MSSIQPNMRYTRASRKRCPICGGFDGGNPDCGGFEGDSVLACTNSSQSGMLSRDGDGCYHHKKYGPCPCGITHNQLVTTNVTSLPQRNQPVTNPAPQKKKIITHPGLKAQRPGPGVTQYEYYNKDGNILFVVRRSQDPFTGKKKFSQHLVNLNGSLTPTLEGYTLAEINQIYNLPRLLKADHNAVVYLVEGEKCVDALQLELDLMGVNGVAITAAGGSNAANWREEMFATLRNRQVMLIPDMDDEAHDFKGVVYMAAIYERLKNYTQRIKWVPLNEVDDRALPSGYDIADWFAEGRTLKEFMDYAKYIPWGGSIHERVAKAALNLRQIAKLNRPRYLLKPYLLKRYLTVIYGPTQSAKTFYALHLALRLAIKGNRVFYVAAENAEGFLNRQMAWIKEYELTQDEVNLVDQNFYLYPYAPRISLQDEMAGFRFDLDKHIDEHWHGDKPDITFIDTLSRTFAGDENDTEAMQNYVHALNELRYDYDQSVCVIHHTGKDEDRGMRGSSVLKNDADTVIFLQPVQVQNQEGQEDPDKAIRVKCEKHKETKKFVDEIWDLKSIDLEEEYIEAVLGEPLPKSNDPDEVQDDIISDSCVLIPRLDKVETDDKGKVNVRPDGIPNDLHMGLLALQRNFPDGLTPKDLGRAIGFDVDKAENRAESNKIRAAYTRRLDHYEAAGYIRKVGSNRDARYYFAAKGAGLMGLDPQIFLVTKPDAWDMPDEMPHSA